MQRSLRLAALGAAALVLVAGGTVLATRSPAPTGGRAPLAASGEPEPSEAAEAPPTADELAHAIDRLKAHGVDASSADLSALADHYGIGGAVRVLAWAKDTGNSTDEITAMRDSGSGWGQIAHELGVQPGLGEIMGNGGGHGRDSAPGQTKDDEPAH